MPKFLTSIDLTKNQLLNASIQNLASAPGTPVLGQIYYNTAENKLYIYNGSSWLDATSVTRLKGSSGGTAAYVTGDLNLVGGSNVTVTQVGSTFTFDVSIPSSTIAFTGDVNDVSSSTGVTTTLTLKNTGVVAGTYGTSNTMYPFTVNAKGLITNVGAGVSVQPYDEDLTQIAGLAGTSGLLKKTGANTWTLDTTAYGTGTVTSVGLSLPNIFTVTNTPVTTAGTFSASLANQNANLILAGPTTGAAATPEFRSLVANDLPNSGVVAASYGSATLIPVFAVDSKGRITNATTASISTTLNVAADAGATTAVPLATDTVKFVGGTGITTTVSSAGNVDSVTFDLENTAVSAGTYGSGGTRVGTFTVNAQGRLTSASNTNIAGATLTGDVTNVSVTPGSTTTVTLSTVNSNVGSFGSSVAIPVVTVNGKGLVTAVSTVTPRTPSLNEVTAVGATSAAAIRINNTTESTNTVTGALIVDGGLGVAKNLNIGGNLTVGGNFTVNGTFSTIGVSTLEITDPIIYLAAGNTTTNLDDIGFVGNYNDGTYAHTGLVKRATDGLWYLFSGVTFEPGATVNFSSYTVDTIKANVQGNVTGNLTGLASRATNIDGGAAGSVPYQSGTSTTAFVAAGTSGTFFKSQGSGAPIWTSVTKSDVGLSNVENTALSTWAGSSNLTTVASNLSLPGAPTTTTAAAGTSTTQVATTGFVSIAVANGTSTLSSKTGKYATSIGNGASTSFVVTHNLGSQDVQVTVREVASPYAIVYPDVELTSTNTCTVYFGSAPSSNAYRVIVVG